MTHVLAIAIAALLGALVTVVPVALLALRWREAAAAEKAAANAWRMERDADRARTERMDTELTALRDENTRLHAATDLTKFMAESAARHAATQESLAESMRQSQENHRESIRAQDAILHALEALTTKITGGAA